MTFIDGLRSIVRIANHLIDTNLGG